LAGLASGIIGTGKDETFTPYQGKPCTIPKKLICIEY